MSQTRTVTLVFKDENDAALFRNWVAQCKERDGTVTGVFAGISCSTVRKAEIAPGPVLLHAPHGERLQPCSDYSVCYVHPDELIVVNKGEPKQERWGKCDSRPASYALFYEGNWYEFMSSRI